MPDPYERHARTKDSSGWEGQNPRAARQAAAAEQVLPEVVPEGKRPPGKKDPQLCKAAHWKGPHTPELRIRQVGWRRTLTCKWALSWGTENVPRYYCNHEAFCAGCGKVLSTSIGFNDCPDSHPVTDGERAEIDLDVERWRERRTARRQPVIDGPQGYRRRKDG